jgi:putative transcriptional regulator
MARRKGGQEKQLAVHNRLAVLRAERQVSRADLAGAVGVNVQTVGFLERGDYAPSVELALRIAEFFRLPVEAVFSLRPFAPLSEQLYATAPQPERAPGRPAGTPPPTSPGG